MKHSSPRRVLILYPSHIWQGFPDFTRFLLNHLGDIQRHGFGGGGSIRTKKVREEMGAGVAAER